MREEVGRPNEVLLSKKQALEKKRGRVATIRLVMLIFAIIFLSAGLVVPFFLSNNGKNATLAAVAGLGHSVLLFSLVVATGPLVRGLAEQIQDLDFEIDLERYESAGRETRAEKLLRINDTQLRRYYDLNLQQNQWMFTLGVGCILIGVIITCSTVGLIVSRHLPQEEKIIAAVLGGLTSLLTNFVAVIYLRMNSTAAQSLAAFHTQLVKTHGLLMSNLLISSIADDQRRWTTLAKLSLLIAGERKDSKTNEFENKDRKLGNLFTRVLRLHKNSS
jgi:hypothetical protein